MNGWGPKSSVCLSKPGKIKLFGRDMSGFCRDIPEEPEKFEKKRFGFNSRPLTSRHFPGRDFSNFNKRPRTYLGPKADSG